ncbi:MAG: hypothetical protein ACKVOK_04485 [Flavobacteriales bacterium]
MKVHFTILLSTILIICNAQTDQENQDKYWKYREMLKNKFVKIGSEPGASIPMACRIPGYAYGSTPDPTGTQLQWKDATITLGYYWIVLATEYKLLSENSQDVQPTLNELYYAMHAFNRVDMTAEGYLGGDPTAVANPSDLNGFFIRDDVRHEMVINFENDPAIPNGPIQPDVGHPNQMRSDWGGWENYDRKTYI